MCDLAGCSAGCPSPPPIRHRHPVSPIDHGTARTAAGLGSDPAGRVGPREVNEDRGAPVRPR
jgi:hypothetical protein